MIELVLQCLGLMNRSFIQPGDAASATREFYHQYRKLWDRGIPVGMGLGHVLLRSAPGGLQFVRLSDDRTETPLDTVAFAADAAGLLVSVAGRLYKYDYLSGTVTAE